jgi:FkbM family methyltransferase
MSSRTRTGGKAIIRKVTRTLGYDLVPLAAGLPALQRRVLAQDLAVALDVGANVGQHAERLRSLGFTGRIISFEPGTAAFKVLSGRAARSPGDWEVRNKALGAEPGVAILRVSQNSVSSSLLPVAEEHVRAEPRAATVSEEEVSVSTLDVETEAQEGGPFWLKLDVQGNELAVLQGGSTTLANTVAVQTEVSFASLYEGGTAWLDLCAYLQERGFTARYLEPGFEDPRTGYMQQADFLFLRD